MMLFIMLDTFAHVPHARNIHLHVQPCSPSAMPLECILTTASLNVCIGDGLTGNSRAKAFVAGEEAVRSAFINVDQAGIGSLTEHQFEAALRQAGIELTRHQIISLHRRLAKDGKVQVEDVLRILI